MKIKKRRQPLDFGALANQVGAPYVDEPIEAVELDIGPSEQGFSTPDFELPPMDVGEPAPRRVSRVQPAAAPEPRPEPAPEPPSAPAAEPPAVQAESIAAPRTSPRVAYDAPRTSSRRARSSHAPKRREPTRAMSTGMPKPWPLYAVAFAVSLVWAGAPIAFAWAYRREIAPFQYDLFTLGVFALLAAGPAVLVWVAAFLVRQGQRLALEAGRAKTLADEMVSPAVLAAGEAAEIVQGVREEIARVSQTAQEARETLMGLRAALADEADRLAETAAASERSAAGLAQTLGRERTEMAGLSQTLDAQALAVAEAITRQARMVAEASDLAETQLREAEASLASRAADLAAAASDASDAARTAGEDLTRHIARLETAGGGVAEQISIVEAGLSDQRAALVAAVHGLRADQENFAAEAETQTAKLADFIGQARLSSAEMGDRAIKGADALERLIAEATGHFRDFAEKARAEREAFAAASAHSFQGLSEAAAEERTKLEEQTRAAIDALAAAAEQTRAAAEGHAEAARAQVDQLSEAAFTAGQRANQVFEARLAEARELIERSAQMVEEAGAATARKLDDGAAVARSTLQDLERVLGEIEARAAQLPAVAREQAEEVRVAVAQSMDDLLEHARRTAEETEAIDMAFQERVRRNYEMLSEAVRLMGTVASGASGLSAPTPLRERVAAHRAAPRPEPAPVQAPEARDLPNAPPAAAPAADAALRPRLRLTPTATDTEFSSVFEAAGGRTEEAAEATEGWTWKELLSSIDEGEGGDSLATEIVAMGIDPAALLPRARIEEVAALIRAGETEDARDMVRRLAPAATRRLTRRLFTDRDLQQATQRHLAKHQALVSEAASGDGAGLAELLATDAGRAYLLFDAAAGDAP